MMEKVKVLTVGAGAVGAYFTGRLAQAGKAEVSVVVRSDYDAVKQSGFHILSECGNFDFLPAGVYRSAEEYPDIPDYIILTSKALPQIDEPALIRGAVKSPRTTIVLIQNGIGIEDAVAEAFPENEIISTIAYIGATRTAPGVVRQKGSSELKFGRFGGGDSEAGRRLAELYQLRGRVGRGSERSYCILMTGDKVSKESRHRIELMCSTENGFELAEEDMKMRGPGDLEGTQQSGLPISLNIASVAKDGIILNDARAYAESVLERDPGLTSSANALLREELRKEKYNIRDYSQIS